MEVTKYLHSCLLLENNNRVILIDPGNYTYESKVFPLGSLQKLDYILITHEHQDHMFLPFIKEIVHKFPNVEIVTNEAAQAVLENEGITATIQRPDFIHKEEIRHEKMFSGEPPTNWLFEIDGYITHPGDSFSFNKTTSVLALPIQAPWGDTTQAVNLALKLKPSKVLPIHDWHWRDEARIAYYQRLTGFFREQGIEFISLETGVRVSI
jgi:L-ascorbate metabolism protein UlaG (beta-lactamase superfamily)